MEPLWIIGLGLIAAVIWGVVSANRKKAAADDAAREYALLIESERDKIVEGDRASLPALDPSEYAYRPVGKEQLVAVQEGASRLEMRSTGRYTNSGTSVSIPIVKGVRYRVGGGRIAARKELTETARGRLLITDKAVSFESSQKNERITWSQIANVNILRDGFEIAKRSGPPRLYQVRSPDPKFAATLEVMLSRND